MSGADQTDDRGRAEREARWLATVRAVALRELSGQPVDIYLFGSRARGDARATSDIDLAVDPRGPVPRLVVARLREALEESTVPVRVDVVDLRDADASFRQRVLREGVRWSA